MPPHLLVRILSPLFVLSVPKRSAPQASTNAPPSSSGELSDARYLESGPHLGTAGSTQGACASTTRESVGIFAGVSGIAPGRGAWPGTPGMFDRFGPCATLGASWNATELVKLGPGTRISYSTRNTSRKATPSVRVADRRHPLNTSNAPLRDYRLKPRSTRGLGELYERVTGHVAQALAATQGGEFDEEAAAENMSALLAYQLTGRPGGATGGE